MDNEDREPFTMIPACVRDLRDGYCVAVYEAIARHAIKSWHATKLSARTWLRVLARAVWPDAA